MVKLLAERAPAKINLFLRVVGRRADGYHELDSVFIPVSLCDDVRVEVRGTAQSGVPTTLALACDRGGIPPGDQNLAWRAAAAFLAEFEPEIDRPHQVAIDLRKKIPAGAGLGGGSSDAGAVLRMMAALSRVEDRARLARVALRLGADVPFFLDPRSAHVGGEGERIAALEAGPRPLQMVIAVPPIEVSTAEIFRALAPQQWSGPVSAAHLRALAEGAITQPMLQNDLAAVAMARHPEIARLRTVLIAAGASAASMSGSGGAVFGIFADADTAARVAVELRGKHPEAQCYAVHSLF